MRCPDDPQATPQATPQGTPIYNNNNNNIVGVINRRSDDPQATPQNRHGFFGTDWEKLKTEYIHANISARELAEKYGINANTLLSRARRGKWDAERKAVRAEYERICAQKTMEASAEAEADRYTTAEGCMQTHAFSELVITSSKTHAEGPFLPLQGVCLSLSQEPDKGPLRCLAGRLLPIPEKGVGFLVIAHQKQN